MAEFSDYDRAPGFWFYIGLMIAADISDNPKLSAKNSSLDRYSFDIFEIFEKGIKRWEKQSRHFAWLKERY